jgi:hypothetical protein
MNAPLGFVLCSKVVGDERMLNGPVDAHLYETIGIDAQVWSALTESGLAEDFSVLAVGIIDRHEDGAIAVHDLERLIGAIENKAAYVDEELAYFLADLRDLAIFALDRNVPVLFTLE